MGSRRRSKTKKPIGVRLEIQDDLKLRLKGVERKLAISIPTKCESVKDTKAYLIEQLFYDHQEIKLYLGDTIREVPDFSSASVFEAFNGTVIRVAPCWKPKRSLVTARDSVSIAAPTVNRVGDVRFEDEVKDTGNGTSVPGQPGPDSESPDTPVFDSPNYTVSPLLPPGSHSPVSDSSPGIPDTLTPCNDSDSGSEFSPISLAGEGLIETDNEHAEAIPIWITASELYNIMNNTPKTRLNSMQLSENIQTFDALGDHSYGSDSPQARSTSLSFEGIERSSPTGGRKVATRQRIKAGSKLTSKKENDDLSTFENSLKTASTEEQNPEGLLNVPVDLGILPTRRTSKRTRTEIYLPLPVFKGKAQGALHGSPRRKKPRYSKNIPLRQLPTLVEKSESADLDETETETGSEDDELTVIPRWTSASELHKIIINSPKTKLTSMQLTEDNKTFEALGSHSFGGGSPYPVPGSETQPIASDKLGKRTTRQNAATGADRNRNT